jgi:hypothetical protein
MDRPTDTLCRQVVIPQFSAICQTALPASAPHDHDGRLRSPRSLTIDWTHLRAR